MHASLSLSGDELKTVCTAASKNPNLQHCEASLQANVRPLVWTLYLARSLMLSVQNATQSHSGNYTGIDLDGVPFPKPNVYPYYSATQSGMCNVYIPNEGTLNRYGSPFLMPSQAQNFAAECTPELLLAWHGQLVGLSG